MAMPEPPTQGNRFTSIEPDQFNTLLNDYNHAVAQKLVELDEERYTTIPKRLQEQPTGSATLSKEEVATLVDWKLAHGKFRPTLRSLVQQNDENTIAEVTRDAFASYDKSVKDARAAKSALATLTKLRGIGPATASLLLSVFDTGNAPFFSDELFRWCMYEDSKGQGWDRDIKYNLKEYLELYDKVHAFKERFRKAFDRELSVVDIEQVAYTLVKGSVDSQTGGEKADGPSKKRKVDSKNDDDEIEEKKKANSKVAKSAPKATASIETTATASESLRRSARRQK